MASSEILAKIGLNSAGFKTGLANVNLRLTPLKVQLVEYSRTWAVKCLECLGYRLE